MRIVLGEDSLLLREGLVRLLTEIGHDVVAQVGDRDSVVAAVTEHGPDVAMIDVRMPPNFRADGLEAALTIRSRHPQMPVLLLSQYVEGTYARELVATGGGVGYLLKDRVTSLTDLDSALATIVAGGTVLDPTVVRQMVSAATTRPVDRLTARERDVIELMAQGRTNTAIAGELFITTKSVEKHISSIFDKLGLAPSADDHRRVLAVLEWLAN